MKSFQDWLADNVNESVGNLWWHGSTDTGFFGSRGIHIGTKLSATQALPARIGVPAVGEWDGQTEYGKTLLAGRVSLARLEKEKGYYLTTGYNAGREVPDEDYYPGDRKEKAVYSDGVVVGLRTKPNVFAVAITGPMTNTPHTPHTDSRANSLIIRQLKAGNAKSGYYYRNEGEDVGSISAVVPSGDWLKIV